MSENSSKITIIEGTGIPVRGNDIDTDRIIPARYLKCVTFDGLGKYAFFDERFDEQNNPKDHPFNDEKFRGGSILVVNKNFGCGSSREHAPQALMRFGVKAIVGESFAEIFSGNCKSLGIPALSASENAIQSLMRFVEENPSESVTVNVEKNEVRCGNVEFDVDIPESVKLDLIKGTWDSTALLMNNKKEIEQTASRLPYLTW